jgi:hypothetical protein
MECEMSGVMVSKPKQNVARGFGEATDYVQCWVRSESGEWAPALFTQRQIETGVARAKTQPEDSADKPPLLARLLARWL